jgi:hypothetical protein
MSDLQIRLDGAENGGKVSRLCQLRTETTGFTTHSPPGSDLEPFHTIHDALIPIHRLANRPTDDQYHQTKLAAEPRDPHSPPDFLKACITTSGTTGYHLSGEANSACSRASLSRTDSRLELCVVEVLALLIKASRLRRPGRCPHGGLQYLAPDSLRIIERQSLTFHDDCRSMTPITNPTVRNGLTSRESTPGISLMTSLS